MALPGSCLSLSPFPLPSCAASEDPGKLLAACCLGPGARNRRRRKGTDRTTMYPTGLEQSRSLRDLATFVYYSAFFSFLLSLPLAPLTDHHHYELSAPIIRSSGGKHKQAGKQASGVSGAICSEGGEAPHSLRASMHSELSRLDLGPAWRHLAPWPNHHFVLSSHGSPFVRVSIPKSLYHKTPSLRERHCLGGA
ncbi:hypothetical protein CKAH01_12924 [Colletotrichum kahawae]|uniref:Uncharacterized protein n=1 Tax=Colletotrichum kahawae TaxID=34407 RepID=A0AAE0DC50_COLKA|nr:hypothetical protein CKAH01_12924 [Colletotrichum kahawae]